MDIQVAVTHQQCDPFKLEAAQLADPKFDEIRVRIMATGVCHLCHCQIQKCGKSRYGSGSQKAYRWRQSLCA